MPGGNVQMRYRVHNNDIRGSVATDYPYEFHCILPLLHFVLTSMAWSQAAIDHCDFMCMFPQSVLMLLLYI